jgi:hypothetical protein
MENITLMRIKKSPYTVKESQNNVQTFPSINVRLPDKD